MYSVSVDDSRVISVSSGRHEVKYASDGSLINPLEAFYAALAGCAAVFAKKACKDLGLSAQGIWIGCKPFAGSGGPLTLARFKTEVRFPDGFSPAQKEAVLEAIRQCAVKKIVEAGASVNFSVAEAASAA